MLERLLARLSGENDPDAGADERDVERMAAVLLVEIARADGYVDEVELDAVRRALGQCSSLPAGELDALVDEAVREGEAATSLHAYTSAVNDAYDKPARVRLVEHLWRVARADGRLDRYEEHAIRRIADLLYVKHRDFMQAKHRVFGADAGASTGGSDADAGDDAADATPVGTG